jgi:hypothetical protein
LYAGELNTAIPITVDEGDYKLTVHVENQSGQSIGQLINSLTRTFRT